MIQEIIQKYKSAEKDKTFPFSDWNRKDVFERLIKDFLKKLGYNTDQIDYDDSSGTVKLEIHRNLKVIMYISSIQEEQRFLSNKKSAPIDTIPDPETGKPEYEIAVVTNFEKWFFYFEGKEIYALTADRLEKEFDTVKALISRDSIESGRFKEVARKLLYKEDNEPLRQELNALRVKIANKILQEKTNIRYLKNPDGTYNHELLNEITTRWITRFLALKLAEDSGITFNFTLRDIRKSFELYGKKAKPVKGAKVKEETLSNAIRALMNEFERRYNGGIFMYEEGVDYITIPDSAFFDLLDFATGWAFTIEDSRIIGFVYERFLGQEIAVEERNGKPFAVLKNVGEARGKKKAGGIYYTPKYIVDYIVENTLGEILNKKKREMESAVKNLDCDKFIYALREVKSLKVLDPACGSGSFLIKVLAEFKNFYEEAKEKFQEMQRKIASIKRQRSKKQMLLITDDEEIAELGKKYSELTKEISEIKFPGTFALRNNIYGVDLDPKAIDISAFTLMVQVYDELKDGAKCPTMIGENLKVGNSLVSVITLEEKEGFISRKELEKFKEEISELIELRKIEKSIDTLSEGELKRLIEENFNEVVDIYLHVKEKYPNAIPTHEQKLLDEWHRRARKDPIEKTFDVLIYQTGLARIFLKEVYFEKIRKIKEEIENEINRSLIKYFNSEKRVLKEKELEEILQDEERVREELKFIKDRATEISKSQPPKVFNWEIEFPEVFFNEDGTLKENPGFDCVVGNPPHGSEIDEIESILIISNPLAKKTNKDTGELFTTFAMSYWLKNGGFFSMVLPKPLVNIDGWRSLREFLKSYEIRKVIDLMNAISGQKQEHIILVSRKHRVEEVGYITGIANKNESRIYETSKIPQRIVDMLGTFPLALSEEELKLIESILDKNLEIGETFISACRGLPKSWTSQSKGAPCVDRNDIERYYHITSTYIKLPTKKSNKVNLLKRPKIIAQRIMAYTKIPYCKIEVKADYDEDGLLTFETVENIYIKGKRNPYFYLSILNSSFISFYLSRMVFTKYFETSMDFDEKYIHKLRFPITTPARQAPIISLVNAIIQKKKEYHAISQNIEDYIDFKKANLIRLDEFLKDAFADFQIFSSLEAKKDNFDALRVRIEDDTAVMEYGIRRKIEEYEEIDEEDEQVEIKGKYIIKWHEAGRGRIRDKEAVKFLVEVLKGKKSFSKAKSKTLWQKIAEVKVPEFTDDIRRGFFNYRASMEKAKELDKEITKIDRAIDRLVYDLYGLTEEEIKVVEKSVWGDKFEEMYRKLPSKEDALRLSEEVKG